MAYEVQQLLRMTQAQLDELFTNSPVGDIPYGEGKGTAIIAAGNFREPRDRFVHQPFRLAGQNLRRQSRAAQKQDFAILAWPQS